VKISEIRDGDRKIYIEAEVVRKSKTREVHSKYSNAIYRVADATLKDESGTITLTLWNEQVNSVRVGDRVKVENGYTRTFRGELQLNSGKYGTLTIL
jgi:replication factor A1